MYALRQQSADSDVAVMPSPVQTAATNRYRKEDSINLTPVQVIGRLYDVAILAIKKDDQDLARRAINELISALNFEYQEVSLGLFRLYDYCKTCLREGKKDEALNVLTELRGAWAEAFKL
ncbi:MAG: flagellar protein FliS [Bacteroidetes bacterium]|nr:flagellar protein FliS [Bacteroidota bacterium]